MRGAIRTKRPFRNGTWYHPPPVEFTRLSLVYLFQTDNFWSASMPEIFRSLVHLSGLSCSVNHRENLQQSSTSASRSPSYQSAQLVSTRTLSNRRRNVLWRHSIWGYSNSTAVSDSKGPPVFTVGQVTCNRGPHGNR